MKQKIITGILQEMQHYLDNAELQFLKGTLESNLVEVEIISNNQLNLADDGEENQKQLDLFIAAKRTEGCSEKSLKYYKTTIDAMLETVSKSIKHIDTDDLRSYLMDYQSRKQSSKITIDNIRRILSSIADIKFLIAIRRIFFERACQKT